jgi:hypothetical protein
VGVLVRWRRWGVGWGWGDAGQRGDWMVRFALTCSHSLTVSVLSGLYFAGLKNLVIGICPADFFFLSLLSSSSFFLFLLFSSSFFLSFAEACTVSTHVVDDPDAVDDPGDPDDLAAWSFFHAWCLEAFADCVTYSRFTSEKSSLLSWPTWSIT